MILGVDARELQGQPTGAGRYLGRMLPHWRLTESDRVIAYGQGDRPASLPSFGGKLVWRSVGRVRASGLLWQERLLPSAARADRVEVFFSPAYQCPLTLRAPRVIAVHDLSFFSCPHDFAPLDGLRRRLLVSASLRLARAVLACSRFTRSEIVARFPWASPRIVHVPLGSDDDPPPGVTRAEARHRLGLSGPLVLWVGSVFNRRCLPELLTALARLARRWPGLVLDVVGDNRTHPRLDLAGLAARLGAAARVRFSGFVSEPELALRYAAADVAVYLSDYEGFGLPAVEAMARGVPLVASDRPAVDEVVGDGALLVDARDVGALSAALDRVLSLPELAASLRARGRATAARYSWRDTAARTWEVLGRVGRS